MQIFRERLGASAPPNRRDQFCARQKRTAVNLRAGGHSPSISVRELAKDDAEYFVEVCSLPHCRGFVHAPTLQQVWDGLASPRAGSFIVNADGRPIGVIRLSFVGEPVWLAELTLLAIAEPRSGFGAEAVRWAQRHAFITLGVHRMYVEVAVHNAAARALYEQCGFVQEGLWREGFQEDDGTYRDLVAYGILDREYAARADRVTR